MQGFRMAVIVMMVMIAAAATIALAYGLATIGVPIWQAAFGPILLAGIILFRWHQARTVTAAKNAAKTD